MANRVEGNLQVTGRLSAAFLDLPANVEIPIAQAQHRNVKTYQQSPGADVAAATSYFYTAAASGTLSGVDVFVDTAPAGGDKHFTVDVKKSSGGGAFATVLTAVVNISSTTSTRSVTAATIASGPYSAGDTFQIVLTPAGSSGSQGQGLLVTGTFDEEPA